MPQSIYDNGGIIGSTLDFATEELYQIGTTQDYLTPTFLGSVTGIGSPVGYGPITLDLTSLNLQDGDIVFLGSAIADSGFETEVLPTDIGWTTIYNDSTLQANDSYDTSAGISYQAVSGSIPTSVTVPSTGDTDNAHTAIAVAFRGLDTSVNFGSVSFTSKDFLIGVNGSSPQFPSLTTTRKNSTILLFASSAHNGSVSATYTNVDSNAEDIVYVSQNDTYDAISGFSYINVSGDAGQTISPAGWTCDFEGTGLSYVSVVIELLPKESIVPAYGNKKNSGIWNLPSVFENTEPFYPWMYEEISSVLLSSSASEITFSGLSEFTGYTDLQIRMFTQSLNGGAIDFSFNANTGSVQGHEGHLYVNPPSAPAFSWSNPNGNVLEIGFDTVGDVGTGTNFGVLVMDIFDFLKTDRFKSFRSHWGAQGNHSAGLSGGTLTRTDAIDSITIAPSADNFNAETRISIYGVRG